jgi:hypothetical protein
MLLKRLDRVRNPLGFLRLHRHVLFNEEFQTELEGMYRDTGAGKDPVPSALMTMATFIQVYLGVSDAEMVELTVVDLRVQMVLDCLGDDEACLFAGGVVRLPRLIRTEMERRLLERTVELAGPEVCRTDRGAQHEGVDPNDHRVEVLSGSEPTPTETR